MTDKTDSKERVGRFTKKPVTIDAWLIDFGNKPLPDWVNEAFRTEAIDWCPAGEGLYINTLEGHMLGTNGSWLIKGVQGELYACKPDIFAATYERASLAANAGSEPVAHTNGVFEFWWADHMPNATHAEAWREWCHLLRPGAVTVTHPSPSLPEGMVMVPIALAIDSPIRDVLITWMEKGIKGECFLYKDMWEAIIDAAPPTTTAGSKGE